MWTPTAAADAIRQYLACPPAPDHAAEVLTLDVLMQGLACMTFRPLREAALAVRCPRLDVTDTRLDLLRLLRERLESCRRKLLGERYPGPKLACGHKVEVRESFGSRLRKRRMARGWSQQALATKTRIRRSTICDLENGKPAGPEIVRKLAEAFGISPAMLIGKQEKEDEAA